MFSAPPTPTVDALFQAGLPQAQCSGCDHIIDRRKHRVMLRVSWRPAVESLCPSCWRTICAWAARFALEQGSLDLFGAELD
jgi:hypothetical protein